MPRHRRRGASPGYVQRLMRDAGRDVPKSERIFELNPHHPLIKNVKGMVERGDAQTSDWIEVLYDQALVAEGAPVEDPAGFSRRMTVLLTKVSEKDALRIKSYATSAAVVVA